MIAVERTALVLLAAGRPPAADMPDLLSEPLLGRPLALHAIGTLAALPFARRLVVRGTTSFDFTAHGYDVVDNARPEAGLVEAARIGVEQLQGSSLDAVLIALAEMPRVTVRHIRHLFDIGDGLDAVVASSDGARACPPVLFGAGQFGAVLALDGAEDARALVRRGRHVVASPAELVDIDTPSTLENLRALFPGGWRTRR